LIGCQRDAWPRRIAAGRFLLDAENRSSSDLCALVRRWHGADDPHVDRDFDFPGCGERRPDWLRLSRSSGRPENLESEKLDILWNVGLPRHAPIFASLKVAVTLASLAPCWRDRRVNRGIGNMMMIVIHLQRTLVFAGLFVLAALGICLYVGFSLARGISLGEPQNRHCQPTDRRGRSHPNLRLSSCISPDAPRPWRGT
jgi:hypothetical protein